jgi:signal transduction histidine kinase
MAPHNGTSNLGLVGLRERVEALGGLFKVESGQVSGVRLSVTIPLG